MNIRPFVYYKPALLSLLSLALLTKHSEAQIVLRDTVCLNQPYTLTTPVKSNSYVWIMGNAPVNFDRTSAPVTDSVATISTPPSWTTISNDKGNWYSFVSSFGNNGITRLTYGNSPLNNPDRTFLGNFGTMGIQGLVVVQEKESVDSGWYCFAVNGIHLMRLDFGNSLSNTPISIANNFSSNFAAPHQISIEKINNEWVGFVANRNGAITRLNFNNGVKLAPTATDLPITNYANVCNFALYQQNNNWYMLACNLLSGDISRLSFGTDINNNTPVVTNLGNFSNEISQPRSINIFSDCSDNQLFAYTINQAGQITKLNFHGDITTTPTATNIGAFPNSGVMATCVYNNQIYGIRAAYGPTVERSSWFTLPAQASVSYGSPQLTNTFTTPGINKVRLMANTGNVMTSYSFCKDVYAQHVCPTAVGKEQVVNAENTLAQNYPNPIFSNTTIKYKLNHSVASSNLIIKDIYGKMIRNHVIRQRGEGSLHVQVDELPNGIYFYSLLADGIMVDTKKMIVSR